MTPDTTTSTTSPTVAVFAPALLLSVEIHQRSDGDDDVHLHAGGQGYWISRMVQALGARAIPCSPIGGESGDALRSIIAADGLDARLTHMVNANSVIIDDRRSPHRRVLADTPIPTLGRHEIDELYSAIVGAAMAAGVCVIAGTQLAPMFDHDTFRRLVADLRRNDVTVIVDVCGGPLRGALESGVDVVKLSHEELVADGWATQSSVAAISAGIGRLRGAGATSVVVSRKDRTTIAGDDGNLFEIRSPVLEVLDGRGGGDSMTAALAVASARGLPFLDGLRIAAAAAALNVTRHGLGTRRRDAIEDFADHVDIKVLGASPATATTSGATKSELYERAKAAGIRGRSTMNRAQLLEALAGPGER